MSSWPRAFRVFSWEQRRGGAIWLHVLSCTSAQNLLCAKNCSRCWGHSMELKEQNCLVSWAYMLKDEWINQPTSPYVCIISQYCSHAASTSLDL
jgi:hypothetical protein